jgi:hypothetical protein
MSKQRRSRSRSKRRVSRRTRKVSRRTKKRTRKVSRRTKKRTRKVSRMKGGMVPALGAVVVDERVRGAALDAAMNQFGEYVVAMRDAPPNDEIWCQMRALPPVIPNLWDHRMVRQAQERALPPVIHEDTVAPEFRETINEMLSFAIAGLLPVLPDPARANGGLPNGEHPVLGLHRQLGKLLEVYPAGANMVHAVAVAGVAELQNGVPEIVEAEVEWRERNLVFASGAAAARRARNAIANVARGLPADGNVRHAMRMQNQGNQGNQDNQGNRGRGRGRGRGRRGRHGGH